MPSDRELLFQGFTEIQKKSFLALGSSQIHTPPEMILKEGELGSEMLIVEEGIMSVWVRDTQVNEIGPESILGVSSLIEPHLRTASLRAETQVSMLLFKRARVLKYLEMAPPKVFYTFFANAFRIHLNLIRQCEERIVKLSQELSAL